jgi:regulator of sigma E protease
MNSAGNLLYYLAAFALVLGVLIVVHEFGHYAVARLCGVKVLRFSVGFGKTLLIRRYAGTDWTICIFPLGGYVKMLDEREGEVAPEELGQAFNRQPVFKRILIVVAGPLANLALAILIYWALFIQGVEELRPLLAAPAIGTPAAAAGIESGDLIRTVNGKTVVTWQEARWEILQPALRHLPATLGVETHKAELIDRTVELNGINLDDPEGDLMQAIGLELYRPVLKPIIGKVAQDSPASRVGLRADDEFTSIDGTTITTWADVAKVIRNSVGHVLKISLLRDGLPLNVEVSAIEEIEKGHRIGRIGVMVREDPNTRVEMMVLVRYPPAAAMLKSVTQTWDTSIFSLKMIGRMLTGELSWRNLSGPVTIADYAGQSARMGATQYLKFLAMISISLGVLNLLPIPILDGGHLLYYLAEIIKGGPVSERVMEVGQQIGLTLLVVLMAFAFYNDINRLISS